MITISFRENQIHGLEKGLELVSRVRGFKCKEPGIKVNVEHIENGLMVEAANGRITINYHKKTDFFRAVALLVGKLESGEREFYIREKGCLEICGILLDLSRNAVLKIERLEELLARIALMGMNCIMPYMEDVFEMKEYEYFGYMRGRYSSAEMDRFNEVASNLGIEIIPHIQTLAHLKTTLRWDYAKNMIDNEDILLIDEPKTYEFIESMFRTIKEHFSTKIIHIGMDEAYYVGLGTYLRKNGYKDRFEIMSRHLSKVCELADKYGFKCIVDPDMFWRLGTESGEYFDFDVHFPENLQENIPQNVSVTYWDYYHIKKEEYLAMIKGHKEMKRDIVFFGGIWNWSGMGPDYAQTFRTTFPALSACREAGINKVFGCLFGDDGGEVSVFTNLLGMQLFAEYNYYAEVDMKHLKQQFSLCTGMNADSFLALAIDSLPSEMTGLDVDDGEIKMGLPVSRVVLYQDVLCGLFDRNLACFALEEEYSKMLANLNSIKEEKGFEFVYSYYRTLLSILKKKVHIGTKIRNAYNEHNTHALAILADELSELSSKYKEYHEKAYVYWHEYNKPFGFDKFEQKIGGVIMRIETAEYRIRAYLNGELDTIEELEEELLWYAGNASKGKLVAVQTYSEISSVGHFF